MARGRTLQTLEHVDPVSRFAARKSLLPDAETFVADKGYDRDALREARAERGITLGNMFAKPKDRRRISMRDDRCAHTFFSAIGIAATVIFGSVNES